MKTQLLPALIALTLVAVSVVGLYATTTFPRSPETDPFEQVITAKPQPKKADSTTFKWIVICALLGAGVLLIADSELWRKNPHYKDGI